MFMVQAVKGATRKVETAVITHSILGHKVMCAMFIILFDRCGILNNFSGMPVGAYHTALFVDGILGALSLT